MAVSELVVMVLRYPSQPTGAFTDSSDEQLVHELLLRLQNVADHLLPSRRRLRGGSGKGANHGVVLRDIRAGSKRVPPGIIEAAC
jgi:hypothetical protein